MTMHAFSLSTFSSWPRPTWSDTKPHDASCETTTMPRLGRPCPLSHRRIWTLFRPPLQSCRANHPRRTAKRTKRRLQRKTTRRAARPLRLSWQRLSLRKTLQDSRTAIRSWLCVSALRLPVLRSGWGSRHPWRRTSPTASRKLSRSRTRPWTTGCQSSGTGSATPWCSSVSERLRRCRGWTTLSPIASGPRWTLWLVSSWLSRQQPSKTSASHTGSCLRDQRSRRTRTGCSRHHQNRLCRLLERTLGGSSWIRHNSCALCENSRRARPWGSCRRAS
mmetsp:Transcript_7745/g.17950  ORF Transcript_7745/g.17950 Transcript_7745/m.17950 type:complete len:276 (-) Transcript_7745:1494-2321(-)